VLAMLLGIFVGPVEAGSRSLLSRVAPEELRHQMFGLYALSGKVAFFCPLLVALLTWVSGSQRIRMSAIVLFLATGFAIMLTVPDERRAGEAEAAPRAA
jgi:MFS transporter, UMF1 family